MTPVSLPWPGGSLVGLRPSGLLLPWLHSRAPLLPQPLVEANRPGRPLAHQVDWTLTIGLAKPRAFRDPRYAPVEYASALRLRARQPPAAPIAVWMHGSEFWFARIIAAGGEATSEVIRRICGAQLRRKPRAGAPVSTAPWKARITIVCWYRNETGCGDYRSAAALAITRGVHEESALNRPFARFYPGQLRVWQVFRREPECTADAVECSCFSSLPEIAARDGFGETGQSLRTLD